MQAVDLNNLMSEPPMILRPDSSVPLYIQIAEHLMAQIENGSYAPGDKLMTERQLSKSLNVQRATVRQALSVLEDRGLIERVQGSGTFVAEAKIEREAVRLFAFTKIMSARGYKVGAKVVSLREAPADRHVAQRLGIAVDAPVYWIHRLRLLDDKPVMLEEFRTPVALFPGLVDHDLEARSLFELMEVEYGRKVTRAVQSLEAVTASPFEAEALGVAPGAALMMEERVTRDQYGDLVEFSRDLYRGDRFRFVVETAAFDVEIKTGGGEGSD